MSKILATSPNSGVEVSEKIFLATISQITPENLAAAIAEYLNDHPILPAYPQDTTKHYILAAEYIDNNWVKFWKSDTTLDNATIPYVGIGKVGSMIIS